VIRFVASAGAALVVCAAAAATALAQGTTAIQQLDPQRLQPPLRAPFTITPSVTVTEEFNDNVNLDNRNKQWDLITGITPGVTINLESPTYRLTAGYNFTAELFLRQPERNAAFDRQSFSLDALYRVSPEVTLTLTDAFAANTNTNLIASENVSTGRNRAYGNTISPGVTWQIDPFTLLRSFGSYSLQRFNDPDQEDSDVYRFDVGVERRLSTRFSATVGYQFGYFDIQNEPKATTHAPRVGGIYRASPTITLSLSGGPIFVERDSDNFIEPGIAASYQQTFAFGSVGASYNRYIGTAGGLGGITTNQSAGVIVDVITLLKGLTVSFAPQYNTEKSRDNRIDVQSFLFPLTAIYRLTPWVAAVASYQFFRQRSDSTIRTRSGNELANDADQNRLFVGLQFGYPIRFDSPVR
jgi:hypothetical protein